MAADIRMSVQASIMGNDDGFTMKINYGDAARLS